MREPVKKSLNCEVRQRKHEVFVVFSAVIQQLLGIEAARFAGSVFFMRSPQGKGASHLQLCIFGRIAKVGQRCTSSLGDIPEGPLVQHPFRSCFCI
jgi:hypothetical protein